MEKYCGKDKKKNYPRRFLEVLSPMTKEKYILLKVKKVIFNLVVRPILKYGLEN